MPIFIPSPALINSSSEGVENFILASKEWIDLQSRITALSQLPSDLAEYTYRYGDSSSGGLMREAFDSMYRLKTVAAKYGNPAQLRSNITENPTLLAGAHRPKDDAYASTVWVLQQAHSNAFELASVLKNIPLNARNEKPGDIVSGIKSLFLDNQQVAWNMSITIDSINSLIAEFEKINLELEEAQEAMSKYTARSSKTRTEVDKEIGELQAKIDELEKAQSAAYDQWLALTIAACAAPAIIGVVGVGVMVLLSVPTGGTSFAVGSAVTSALAGLAGAALGTAAGIARSKYDNLIAEIASKNEFLQKRTAYRNDLTALDNHMKFTLPAASGIIDQLKVIRNAWQGTADEIKYRANDLSVTNLHSSGWLNVDEMEQSAKSWLQVDTNLRAFITGSFVDSTVLNFGDEPQDEDPEFREKFLKNIAA